MSTSTSAPGGIGIVGALGLLFVALKLLGKIDWPWLLVTVPFWGVFALLVLMLTLGALGIGAWFGIGSLIARIRR